MIAGSREPGDTPSRPGTAAGKGAVRRAASSDVTVCSLAAHGFLRGMPQEMLAELVPAASLVQIPAGRRLFEDGGHAAHFWLIRSGSVALDLHVPGHGWVIIETLGLGEVVGWSWLFPPYEWAFGAVATQPTEAFQFDAQAVRKRCDANPALGYQLTRRFLAVLANRLQASRMRLINRCAPPKTWP
ncbi:MAG TPA: cyclic nucleotide-binding domain-containing protein [Streptosporangiaceae bacterium]|nr:cyclic nucleotide-binding domain-containing protein [Streptosporangiaceae bacterium]